MRIALFLAFCLPLLAPAEFVRQETEFSFGDKARWQTAFYEGGGEAVFAGGKAKMALHCKAAALFPATDIDLHRPAGAVCETDLLEGAAELRLSVADRRGRQFRSGWQTLSPGKNEAKISFAGWLEKAEFPVRFSAISLRSPGESAVVEIRKLLFSDEIPAVQLLEFSCDSGYPVNIENPESGKPVKLRLFNRSSVPIRALCRVEVSPFVFEEIRSFAAGESFEIALPPAEKRGIRYGTLTLASSENPALRREESFSVAVMTPALPTQEKARGFLFGICAHPQRYPVADQEREAAAAALCGAKILREDALWERIQPEQGVWDYSSLDRTVELFAEQGLELELIYSYTPAWAVAKDFVPLKKERLRAMSSRPDLGAWREFVQRTAARYRGKIRFFEVWNEPDLYSFSNFKTEAYIEMLKIAGEETRKANPEAIILTGGYTCMPPSRSLNDQLHQEKTLVRARGSYDVHAFHGHGPFVSYAPQIERLVEMRKRLGVTEPWWANETALHSVHKGEQGQAEALWQKLFFSWANGSIGYNWYDLRNDGVNPVNVEHNYGMVRKDFNPKMVYAAYNTITRNFAGAEFEETVTVYPALRLYRFGTLFAGWNESPDKAERLLLFKTDAAKAEQFDLFDNRSPITVSEGWALVPVSNAPFGLRFASKAQAVAEPLAPAGAQLLSRGENVIRLRLANHFPTPETFELALRLPDQKPLRYQLAAGEKREVAIPVLCEAEPAPGSRIGVELKIRNLAGFLTFPVRSAVRIGTEFAEAPDFVLNERRQLTSLVPADPAKAHLEWRGPEDLSAEIRLALTPRTLKLKAVVTDDVHFQPFRDGESWLGDNIQLGLQAGNRKSWEIGLTRLADGSSQAWIWDGPLTAAAAIKLETSRSETKKQTSYEAEIPLEALNMAGERAIRFNLLVNDNDGELRKGFLRIAPGLGEGRTADEWPILVEK